MSEKSKVQYLDRADFELCKVKTSSDGMLVAFVEVRKTEKGTVRIPHTVEPPYQAHPELVDLFDKLKVYVLNQYDHHKQMQAAEGNDAVLDAFNEIKANLTVYGLSVSGLDQLKGAIINGKLKTESGTRAMPTGRIVFSSDKLGYEQEVQQMVDLVESEVYDCLFNGKRANKDLFNNDDVKQPTPSEKQGVLG